MKHVTPTTTCIFSAQTNLAILFKNLVALKFNTTLEEHNQLAADLKKDNEKKLALESRLVENCLGDKVSGQTILRFFEKLNNHKFTFVDASKLLIYTEQQKLQNDPTIQEDYKLINMTVKGELEKYCNNCTPKAYVKSYTEQLIINTNKQFPVKKRKITNSLESNTNDSSTTAPASKKTKYNPVEQITESSGNSTTNTTSSQPLSQFSLGLFSATTPSTHTTTPPSALEDKEKIAEEILANLSNHKNQPVTIPLPFFSVKTGKPMEFSMESDELNRITQKGTHLVNEAAKRK